MIDRGDLNRRNRKAPRKLKYRKAKTPSIPMLIVHNWIAGSALGIALAVLLLWSDFARLGRLMGASDQETAAMALLFGGFAVTFGSAVAGTAIMLTSYDES